MFTKKDTKKLSKKDMLELLVMQSKKIDELEIELEKTKKELNNKKITIKESGSIAEAALKLNQIFEIAQKAADQYLVNVKNNNQIEKFEYNEKNVKNKENKNYEKNK